MSWRSIPAFLVALVASWSVVCGTAHAQTSTVGRWDLGPVWDIAPVHMMLTPNGKVIFWPGDYISGDDPRSWDPVTSTLTSLPKAGYDLFCAGHAFLGDGTLFVSGGNLQTPFNGLPNASIFNPFTNVWTPLPDMNAARWYPTTTFTGTGEVLVMTGMIDSVQLENPLPQVWQPSTGTWRNLTNALRKIYNYSWVYWTQFGNAIVVGPRQTTSYLNISGTGAWTDFTQSNYPATRDYGSSVMYATTGKILIAGGAQPPTNTAEIIDISAANPTWQYTNPMAFARRHMNMTLLPDDNVLVTGGTSGDGFNDTTKPVYPSEMWNPTTKAWTTMASQTVGRFYHSNALLLPDGRVLSAGGNYTYQTEIYSPPYLFKGARPTITSAPSTVQYSATFFVGTPDATSIVNARLIRLPSVTHAFDMDQRIVQVSFTQTTGGLNLTAPSDRNQTPVGYYMLFILNGSGVPSVAKIIQVGASSAPPAAPAGLTATAVSSNAINLVWTDQANNEDGFKIERKTGTGAFAQIATVGPNITTYADSGLTASTTYSYQVRASNTAGNSAYSNTASATTAAAASATVNMSLVFADSGFAYYATQNFGTPADTSSFPTRSVLRLFENGIELGPAHSTHANIRTLGQGRFSHWDDGSGAADAVYVLFSASDNTNPKTNGRTYTYQVGSTSTLPPTAPTGLGATATSSTAINLSWTDAANNEDGFKIERKTGTGAFAQIATVGPNITMYADSGLTASTGYSYQVRAYNTGGNSAYSNTASATTLTGPPPPPAPPSGLGATATSSTAITLNWTDASTNEDGFKIERKTGAGAFAQIATVGPNITTYADSGLTASTAYSYQVRAYNAAGDSAYSNTASATTLATAPTAPTGLVATAVAQTQINLTWVDNATNEDGFKIERKSGGGSFAQIGTVAANVKNYADTGLTRNTQYTYRVRAYNSIGDSGYSNSDGAKTNK